MNKKIMVTMTVIFVLMFGVVTLEAHAKTKGHGWNLEKKFSCKTHLILKNTEELGLSDKQVEEIKDLKIATKKDLIRKSAEIDIAALEIKAKMWADPMDTDAINKLVDKKYDLKKEKTKSLIAAYATLKGTLTDGQKTKLKEVFKKCKKEMKHKSMMKGKSKSSKMCDRH